MLLEFYSLELEEEIEIVAAESHLIVAYYSQIKGGINKGFPLLSLCLL